MVRVTVRAIRVKVSVRVVLELWVGLEVTVRIRG